MNTLGIVLLVFFIIVSVLLILLVIIQDDGENGMGGLLGGRGTAAFGSHSASVLTKATGVFAFLFFCLALSLAYINKKGTTETIMQEVENSQPAESTADESNVPDQWWNETSGSSTPAETPAPAENSEVGSNLELPSIDLSGLTLPETLPLSE